MDRSRNVRRGSVALSVALFCIHSRYQSSGFTVPADPAVGASTRLSSWQGQSVTLQSLQDVPGTAGVNCSQTNAVLASGVLLLALGTSNFASSRRSARTACAGKKKGGGKKDKKGGGGKQDEDDGGEAEEVDTEELMRGFKDKMTKSVDVLQEALMAIRVGRASPAMLDNIMVEAYETKVTLKEVGNVTVVDSTTLMINVFDEANVSGVSKGILTADLGYNATEDGSTVKVSIPPMTSDKRVQFQKLAKETNDKSKVAIRNIRQTAMKKIKSISKSLGSEDIVKGLEKEVESLVKKYSAECDTLHKKKDEELAKA
eukprot:TRINITY_DN115421_c0_g1_i1.p1 TRINITY_DN115421_c0_g1~~TRINITY_DN115421_c0_g1_i1.p1  ORF type:complete len:315 (-),score=78.04 TRINITY_DN115421_c0_g1_i1:51-995(-)